MRNNRRVLLGGAGLLVLACAGKNLNNVGELNHAVGGSSGSGGSKESSESRGGDAVGAGAGAGAAQETLPGGAGGVPNLQPPDEPEIAGAGGGGELDPDVGTGVVFQAGLSKVTAVTADATTLYWVEHGTKDTLGNYQNDGRLMACDFDSEEARVLADDLPGPVGVALTSEHAFVFLDQFYDNGLRDALARLPLTGGSHEIVAIGVSPYSEGPWVCAGCFVHDGDTGYFPFENKVYRISPEDTEAELFVDMPGYRLAAGVDALYVESDGGIWGIPYDTAIAENVTTEARYNVQVSSDYLYAIEARNGTSFYLVRMPIAGGPWVRLPPKRVAGSSRLQILDELFFHDVRTETGAGWRLVQGSLADTASAQVALELRWEAPRRVWIGTHAGVFWNDGPRVMHVPLAVE